MASADTHVLVVDDEPIVREILERYLARDGFRVTTKADGDDALAAFRTKNPDIVVLDLMIPGIDGLEVLRRIRGGGSTTPVIMLTARGEETDRVVGLDLGADDYVTKPFSPREIVARVRAVLRRSPNGSGAPARTEAVKIGRILVDSDARVATRDGEPVSLTPKEFDLLEFFASHLRTVYSRPQLLEELWDLAYDGDPSTVTVHIRRLREKIEDNPSEPKHLVTVWGAGYRMEP